MHRWFRPAHNRRRDEFFETQAIDTTIEPGQTVTGFVFANRDERAKCVKVHLYGERQAYRLQFFVEVPGMRADSDTVDFEALYAADRTELTDEGELGRALGGLPSCTTRLDGSGCGDPLNFVLIGTPDEIGGTLTAGGWYVTQALSPAALLKTVTSFALGRHYRYSPMSPLYVFGRRQDAGFQKARDSIHHPRHRSRHRRGA